MTILPAIAETLPLAAAEIRAARSIVMACHVNPDGDALGSMLGLAHGLRPLGKDVTLLSQDGVPDIYQFLPGSQSIQTETRCEHFDLALVLDSGELARVGDKVQATVSRAARMIDIDHHAVAGAFGDLQVINAQAASTSEIVYQLLRVMDLPIMAEAATCLFTGVTTDTGSFRYQNVTPTTMRIAADLLEAGAPPAVISENVFENKTYTATKILGHALSSLSRTEDGRIVWARITAQDFAALQATDADTEGIVGPVRGVRGADVGVLFREVTEADGTSSVRVSLRSREGVDVAVIAQKFGGGGHRMAAGCTLPGPLAAAEAVLLDALREVWP